MEVRYKVCVAVSLSPGCPSGAQRKLVGRRWRPPSEVCAGGVIAQKVRVCVRVMAGLSLVDDVSLPCPSYLFRNTPALFGSTTQLCFHRC